MTTENMLRDFVASWNTHDHNAAASMMTEDCIFEPSVGPDPWGDRLIGRSAVREWALATFAKIPDIHWEPLRFFSHGDYAVYEYRMIGTPKGAAAFDVFVCDVLTLRNNQVYAKRAYRKTKP